MGKPAVLRFNARLDRAGTVLDVPEGIDAELRGMPKVEGTVNGHPFRAALEPNPSGGRRLKVNKAMRRGAGAGDGDAVELAILGPEPDPKGPADLRTAFKSSDEAKSVWDDLATMGRQDWVRWIESAKTPETRARRITRTIDQLSEGKRRACCVNVYEYMLNRVDEDEQRKGRK